MAIKPGEQFGGVNWRQSTASAQPLPDDCPECGGPLGTAMVGKDKKIRCIGCHVRNK